MRTANSASKSDEGFYSVVKTLKTPFTVLEGRLVVAVATDSVGPVAAPLEANESLYLERGRARQRIDSLAALRGRVHITSPAGAMAFVRLISTVETYFLFRPKNQTFPLDLIDTSKMAQYDLYGLGGRFLPDFRDGFFGYVRHKRYQSLGIPDAVSKPLPDGFLVERPVILFHFTERNPRTTNRVVVIRQKVGVDGAIIDLGQRDLGDRVAHSCDWYRPIFE